jgi:hypothetical protein
MLIVPNITSMTTGDANTVSTALPYPETMLACAAITQHDHITVGMAAHNGDRQIATRYKANCSTSW